MEKIEIIEKELKNEVFSEIIKTLEVQQDKENILAAFIKYLKILLKDINKENIELKITSLNTIFYKYSTTPFDFLIFKSHKDFKDYFLYGEEIRYESFSKSRDCLKNSIQSIISNKIEAKTMTYYYTYDSENDIDNEIIDSLTEFNIEFNDNKYIFVVCYNF